MKDKNRDMREIRRILIFIVKFIIAFVGVCIFVIIANPNNERARTREITGYLDKHLEEPYKLSKGVVENDRKYKYEVYLTDEKITVPLYYSKQYNDAVNTYWGIDHFELNYYAAKVEAKKEDRAKVLKDYPEIREEMNIDKSYDIDDVSVNIYIKDIKDIDEVYDYLIESYKINNYKLYVNSGTLEEKSGYGYWYFDDYNVKIHIYVNNQEIMICNYYNLRENKVCKKDELYNFISKETFTEKCLEKYDKMKNNESLSLYW